VPCAGEGRPDCSSIEVTTSGCRLVDNEWIATFTITNTGDPGEGDMAIPSEYRIYVNDVLVLTETFQLPGGGSLDLTYVASAGDKVRLEADQQPGHPGKSMPRATAECGGSTLE
jgi:hypothetical protein